MNRLMMAALDGEIGTEERRELELILERDHEIRTEWEKMNRVKEVTGAMKYREPPEEVWGVYWVSVYNRVERGLGWILISVGGIILLTFAAWEMLGAIWVDSTIPWYLKLAIFSVVVGLIVLAVSVIREKLFTYKHDRYKEIER